MDAVKLRYLEVVQMLMQHMQERYMHQQMLSLMRRLMSVFPPALQNDAIWESILRKIGPDMDSPVLKGVVGLSFGEDLLLDSSANCAFRSLQMLVKLNVPRHHDGRTALHDAPTYEIAEYPLRQDHSLLWARDASGCTVFHGARNGAIAECFLHKDPSMLSARNTDGETPSLKAFARNNMELWQTLSKHGGNAHDRNNDGQTGLHLVAKTYHVAKCNLTAEFLIEQDLAGIRDHGGNTALHLLYTNIPCYESYDSCVLQILDAGEKFLSTNMTGVTVAELVLKAYVTGWIFSWKINVGLTQSSSNLWRS